VTQVVDHLPSKRETLSSNPNTVKKKKKEEEKKKVHFENMMLDFTIIKTEKVRL
jgi:hypothetical protein